MSAHFGMKLEPDDINENKIRKEFEKQREILVDATMKKALAYSSLPSDIHMEDNLIDSVKEMKKWIDIDEYKYLEINGIVQKTKKQWGSSLKSIKKHLDNGSGDKQKLLTIQLEIVKLLGWNHWYSNLSKWKLIKFPPQLPPF